MKILLAYRGAPSHTEGIMLTLEYAKKFNAEVFFATSLMFGDKDHAFTLVEKGDIEANFEAIEKIFKSEGISYKKIIFENVDPAPVIVKFAKDQNIDLIIIGVRIRSRVGKLLLGSNAQYVILNAHCPVLSYKEV
jgi:nucleotide-binding universal stress UspA family protein